MKLFEFQIEGAKRLAKERQFGLFDEPGLGKTAELLCALQRGVPVLIVVPASVKLNWAREAAAWRRDYRVLVCRTTREFRWPQPGEIVIASYEILPPSEREIATLTARMTMLGTAKEQAREVSRLQAQIARGQRQRKRLVKPKPGTVIVADEAHRLKNGSARRTGRWREMATLAWASGGRIYLLTGSPLVNNPPELWTVLQAAGLGTKAFGSRGAYDAAVAAPGAVAAALQTVSIRRLRVDVLPWLPPKTRERRLVDVDPGTMKQLDELVARLRARGVNLEIMTLEQIKRASVDAQLSQFIAATRERLAVAKIPAVLDYVVDMEEQGVPLVVFSVHLRPVQLLGRRKGWGRIVGEDSVTDRQRAVDAFQAGRLRGMAITSAGGEGITLTRAWCMPIIDTPWTPSALGQAEDRIYRIGQKARGVLFPRFVANHPLEKRVDEILIEKQGYIDTLVDASAVPGTPVPTAM